MPDGDYALGRQVVHKCAGGVRLDDGTLAGSVLTMDQALRNLIALGMDVAEARCAPRPMPPITWAWPTVAAWPPATTPTWWCWTGICPQGCLCGRRRD
jgi:hypothetical protein